MELRIMFDGVFHKVLLELDDSALRTQFGLPVAEGIIAPHIVWQVCSEQNQVARRELFDAIAYKATSEALLHINNLVLAMKVPRIGETFIVVIPRLNRVSFRYRQLLVYDLPHRLLIFSSYANVTKENVKRTIIRKNPHSFCKDTHIQQ